MKNGRCHLCNALGELQESHVWPRFAYKRYVSDQAKGGRFTDLMNLKRHNKQWKQDWFCRDCEQDIGRFENYAAELLSRLEADVKGRTHTMIAYCPLLFPFLGG